MNNDIINPVIFVLGLLGVAVMMGLYYRQASQAPGTVTPEGDIVFTAPLISLNKHFGGPAWKNCVRVTISASGLGFSTPRFFRIFIAFPVSFLSWGDIQSVEELHDLGYAIFITATTGATFRINGAALGKAIVEAYGRHGGNTAKKK
jgi:hypothetical protein